MSEPFDVPDLIARLRRANTMTLAFEQKEASGCNKYMRYARRKDGKASWVSPFKDVFGDGNLSFITKTGKRGTKKDAIHKKEESRFEHIIRPDRDRMIVDCDRTVFNACEIFRAPCRPVPTSSQARCGAQVAVSPCSEHRVGCLHFAAIDNRGAVGSEKNVAPLSPSSLLTSRLLPPIQFSANQISLFSIITLPSII